MRDLSGTQAPVQALKADVLSLTAGRLECTASWRWRSFHVFRRLLRVRLEVATPEFWFMQVAGFVTS
jgi:hypothetical protein